MKILTIPNWSFDEKHPAYCTLSEIVHNFPVELHYLHSDPDHNRTVLACSGPQEEIFSLLRQLCTALFPQIDLRQHKGAHPRIGALDVCPFVLETEQDFQQISQKVEKWAAWVAKTFKIPVFLYEKSAIGHVSDLPSIRKANFEQLLGKSITPNFGPHYPHPRLGATVTGIRNFLIAMNINLDTHDITFAKKLASEIRTLRTKGDPRFIGVRSLGFELPTRKLTQISFNLTQPDLTTPDSIITWIAQKCTLEHIKIARTELIGVIREKDLQNATLLEVKSEQVVSGLTL